MSIDRRHPTQEVYTDLIRDALDHLTQIDVPEFDERQLWLATLCTLDDMIAGHNCNLALDVCEWLLASERIADEDPKFRRQVYELARFLDEQIMPIEVYMFDKVLDLILFCWAGVEMPPVLHAHIETSSRDCDGPHQYETSVPLRPEGHPDGRWSVHDLIATMLPTGQDFAYSVYEDRSPVPFRATWSYEHDEGGTSECVTECEDWFCTIGKSSQRDVFAEQMGY